MRSVLLIPGLTLALLFGGCASMKEVVAPPELSPVREELDVEGGRVPPMTRIAANTAWRPARANLFSDRVALRQGEILTVTIAIDDQARLQNRSDRERNSGRTLSANGSIAGLGTGGSADGSAGLSSSTTFDGSGGTVRSESIRLSVAAVVTHVLPNGNLVVDGRQEVRVNDELRVLRIEGIVRPADITAANTVAYERIAEARVSYGGRGPIAEVQRPPYGQRVLDHVLPF